MTRRKTTIAYEKSSGNVFADLGLPHPEQELLKARLTLQIYRDIAALLDCTDHCNRDMAVIDDAAQNLRAHHQPTKRVIIGLTAL